MTGSSPPPPRWSWRRSGGFLLEAIGLCGLAVTQPVLDLLSHTPELFLFRGATATDIVVLVLAIAVVPAAVVWIGGSLAGVAAPRHAATIRSALLAVVVLGLLLVWLKALTPASGPTAVLLALAGAVAFGLAHARIAAVATWTRLLALATPVFVFLALFQSPLAPLVRTGEADVADLGDVRAPPVVFITLDELPTTSLVDGDGRIDASLYPNLASFADDSTWYRNYSSVSTTTVYAVPSMLTGRYPVDGRTPTSADHPDSLFTWLGGTYDVHAAESWTRLCPTNVCDAATRRPDAGLLARDAVRTWWDLAAPTDEVADPVGTLIETATPTAGDSGDPGGSDDSGDSGDSADGAADSGDPGDGAADEGSRVPFDAVEADVEAFIDGIEPTTDPTLHYLHSLTPHQPWRLYPSGHQYSTENETYGRPFVDQWYDEEWPVVLGRQRHLLQTMHADALVGRILDRLRETDLYDRSLVIVTADHGIGFQPGALSRGDGPDEPTETWSELIGVPLLIKAPGQVQPQVVDDNVQSVDLLPTLADLLDIELTFEVEGTSAFAPGPRSDTKRYFQARVDWNERRTVAGEERQGSAAEAAERTVERGLDSFRIGRSGELDLYRVGPGADLVGEPLDSLAIGEASALGITTSTTVVDGAGGGPVDALVNGPVDGPGAADATVVAVVDGTVAGAGQPFPHQGAEAFFAALLPEPLLGPARHEVTFYELDGDGGGEGGGAVLRPMTVRGHSDG